MKNFKIAITFGILCVFLSSVITIQLKLANSSESTSSQARITDGLKDEVFKLSEENNNLKSKLVDTGKTLEEVRDNIANNSADSLEKSNLIKKYEILSCETKVEGQGVSVTYTPTKNKYSSEIAKDIRDIVNELKNAGSEAIEVNNHRLVNTSSIEMVKNKVELDGKVLQKPFIIKAIGDVEVINSGLIRPGGIVENIRNSNVKVEISKEENIKIDKYKESYEGDE